VLRSRTTTVSRAIFALPLVLAAIACGAPRPSATNSEADRAAIEALHHRDERAVLTANPDSLIAIWTEDIVSMPAGGPIVRGKAANEQMLRAALAQPGEHRPLSYELRFEEIKMLGDWALEWGTYRGTAAMGPDTVVGTGKLMRLLARDSTGTWRVARTIFTADPITRR
jgi:ketosteroid isomerase-like protein